MKKKISIVGGGASALLLACELDPEKFDVNIYEKNAALGRKFLVAGEGGLNLTHSENEVNFLGRYTPYSFLQEAFAHFSNKHLMLWLKEIGIETFVGSSGRVFPRKEMKPIEAFNIILDRVKKKKVLIHTKHCWKGFSEKNDLLFEVGNEVKKITSDYTVFCLGGASWPVTGSAGDWTDFFSEKKITILPFRASNCAFKVDWPSAFISKTEGKVLKNISTRCANKTHLGEIVITRFGLEGSGIYPLSPEIRKQLDEVKTAEIFIDFKPNLSREHILKKLELRTPRLNLTDYLKTELNLSEVHVALLKSFLSKEEFLDAAALVEGIKQFKLKIVATAPIEDAISTTGGISLSEIDKNFQLKKLPHCFVIGEMLDYDAPTGGYLLQSCFSMAKYLADHLNESEV